MTEIPWEEGVAFEVKYAIWEDDRELTFFFIDLRSTAARVSDVVADIEAVLRGKDIGFSGNIKSIRELPRSGIALTAPCND